MANSQQVAAAVYAIAALAEAIRELGEVPSGHLYASVMAHMDARTFESFVDRLIGAGLVEKRSDLLRWVGPTISA